MDGPRAYRRVVSVGRAVVHEARRENVSLLAGSIAYHAFVSLVPLLLLLVLALSAVGDVGLKPALEALVHAALTRNAGAELLTELARVSGSRGFSLASVVLLLWGSLRIFRGLDTAFSEVYDTEAENSLPEHFADALLLLGVFSLVLLAASALHRYLPSGGGGWLWPLGGRLLLVAALTVALFPMYYVFPDTDVGVVEVLPGTVFAAVGLILFETLFKLYSRWSSAQPRPSIVMAVIVFLTWLYVSGFVILVGAVVNAVVSNRGPDVSIEPVLGGVSPSADRPAEDDVVRGVADLESLLATSGPLTVSVDDRSVTLPAPRRVSVDADRTALEARDVGVELRWAIEPESPSGDGEGASDVERSVELDREGEGPAD